VKGQFELQSRRGHRGWHRIRRTDGKRHVFVHLRRGRWTFRIRSTPAFGRPGPWTVRHANIDPSGP
jgi:hypothetical protein